MKDFTVSKNIFVFQENLEDRVLELEQILHDERVAAQKDRAAITKLQRQLNKVRINKN